MILVLQDETLDLLSLCLLGMHVWIETTYFLLLGEEHFYFELFLERFLIDQFTLWLQMQVKLLLCLISDIVRPISLTVEILKDVAQLQFSTKLASLLLKFYIHFVKRLQPLVNHEASNDEIGQIDLDVTVSLCRHHFLLRLSFARARLDGVALVRYDLLKWIFIQRTKLLKLRKQYFRYIDSRLRL